MAGETSLKTVYRSANTNAEADSAAVKNLLIKAGLNPVLLDGTVPGIVSGTWEVRVPADEAPYAQEVIGEIDEDEEAVLSSSSEFDLVPVAATEGALSEMEAISIKAILDANGINAVIVGASQLPNLGFEVRVADADLDRSQRAIAEAQAAGPAGALEAESAGEPPDQKGA